jgi:hypothetical protein
MAIARRQDQIRDRNCLALTQLYVGAEEESRRSRHNRPKHLVLAALIYLPAAPDRSAETPNGHMEG